MDSDRSGIKFTYSSNKECFLINPLCLVYVTKVVCWRRPRWCPLNVILYFVFLHISLKDKATPPQNLLLSHVRIHQWFIVLRKVGPTTSQRRLFKLKLFLLSAYFGTGGSCIGLGDSIEIGNCFLLLQMIVEANIIEIIELICDLSNYFYFIRLFYPVDEQFQHLCTN